MGVGRLLGAFFFVVQKSQQAGAKPVHVIEKSNLARYLTPRNSNTFLVQHLSR